MRRKYIEDFSELERMLVMDTNFIQYACNGYEDRGLLKCIIQIMSSIYLYFQYQKNWTLEDVERYVDTIIHVSESWANAHQYHYINTIKIAIEHHDKNQCIMRQSERS